MSCHPHCHPRRIFVNLEVAEKIYSRKGEHMCPVDGYVCFRNSELICGRVGKVRRAHWLRTAFSSLVLERPS